MGGGIYTRRRSSLRGVAGSTVRAAADRAERGRPKRQGYILQANHWDAFDRALEGPRPPAALTPSEINAAYLRAVNGKPPRDDTVWVTEALERAEKRISDNAAKTTLIRLPHWLRNAQDKVIKPEGSPRRRGSKLVSRSVYDGVLIEEYDDGEVHYRQLPGA